MRISACWVRRAAFGVQLSACTFRRAGFGVEVSARSFRQRHTVLCGKHTLSFVDKVSSVDGTQCPLWETHTLSFVASTQCPLWNAHIVLRSGYTLSSVESTHCAVWKQQNLLRGNDKYKTKLKFLVYVVFRDKFRTSHSDLLKQFPKPKNVKNTKMTKSKIAKMMFFFHAIQKTACAAKRASKN